MIPAHRATVYVGRPDAVDALREAGLLTPDARELSPRDLTAGERLVIGGTIPLDRLAERHGETIVIEVRRSSDRQTFYVSRVVAHTRLPKDQGARFTGSLVLVTGETTAVADERAAVSAETLRLLRSGATLTPSQITTGSAHDKYLFLLASASGLPAWRAAFAAGVAVPVGDWLIFVAVRPVQTLIDHL